MDANGLRFWMLAEEGDWTLPKELVYSGGAVRLSGVPGDRLWPGTKKAAQTLVAKVPKALDAFDRIAFAEVAADVSRVKGTKAGSRAKASVIFEVNEPVTDLAIGANATLYVATASTLWLRDLHFGGLDRWEPVPLRKDGVRPWRLAADPAGGCWVLCGDGLLARASGAPIPHLAEERYVDAPVRPLRENAKPPSLDLWFSTPVIAAGEDPTAICCSVENGVAVIAWTAA